ncbi:MAG: tRNA lysidine(34) synthetase TilS [Bacilli bacterium]|nr:tRNA lysidine(34) synthetase TilS [Bacilli bacterium]
MNSVYKFIEKLNINNNTVIAAISGGPDSMLLLDILLDLRDKMNLKIVVAHVHHNLRKESDYEAIEVEKFCKKNNLIFELKKIDKYPNGKFSEEIARKIRYEFFDKIIKKYNSNILFTAHHGDDLIETVLMRLTRGSTIKGYSGFETISYDRGYKIARPLIFLTKKEIEEILNEKGIWYAKDMSNENDKYTRNRYRKYILPELKKENNNVHLKFIEFNEKLLMANNYLKKESDKYYEICVINNEINITKFNELDDIIKMYILEKYLKNIYKDNITEINNTHINIIINYMLNNINTVFDLPYNKKGIIEYNKFKVAEKINTESYEYTFNDYVELPNGKSIKIDNNTELTNNYVIHLNSKDIKLPFHVRNYRNGDRMIVKNMLGSKKISDIFIDVKLSKELRSIHPIVTDDTGEIIWIPGIKKSHFDMKKEQKYDIILKYD